MNGPTCSFRRYLPRIFTGRGPSASSAVELQASHWVVGGRTRCIFHPPAWQIQGPTRCASLKGPPTRLNPAGGVIPHATGLVRASHLLVAALFLCPMSAPAQGAQPSGAAQTRTPASRWVFRNGKFQAVSAFRADTDSLAPRRLPGSDLDLQLFTRFEARTDRIRNERCNAAAFYNPSLSCNGSYVPTFDFQFAVKSKGTVANRVSVDVDYDSQREFDASNNISLVYQTDSTKRLSRLEVGNVSFAT